MNDARADLSARIRFDVPNVARVWSYWLGGTEHYPIDRAAADEFVRLYPHIVTIAREARRFQARAITELAGGRGVRQFLDIGCGLPTGRNTHEVAQGVAPDARVVYVDNDPVVLAYCRAWMGGSTPEGGTYHLDADLRRPADLLRAAAGPLDLGEPVAVLLSGVLGYAADTPDRLRSTVGALLDGLPAGSYLVLCEGADDGDPAHREACRRHGYHLRTVDQLRAVCEGLELVEPGLVPVNTWRAGDDPGPPLPTYAAVARKP